MVMSISLILLLVALVLCIASYLGKAPLEAAVFVLICERLIGVLQ